MREAILAFCETWNAPVREAEINEEVEGRRKIRQVALRLLVKDGRVIRHGKGGKGDPYRYAKPGIPDGDGREPESDETNTQLPLNADEESIQVPWYPASYISGTRIPESKN